MGDSLTIALDAELKAALALAANSEGESEEDLVRQAIRRYLFMLKFQTLRTYLIAKSQRTYTDDDIFELVS